MIQTLTNRIECLEGKKGSRKVKISGKKSANITAGETSNGGSNHGFLANKVLNTKLILIPPTKQGLEKWMPTKIRHFDTLPYLLMYVIFPSRLM